MKIILLCAALLLCLGEEQLLAANEKLNSEEALRIGVENDDLYFLPQNREAPLSWSGTVYEYASKNCFTIKHNMETHKVEPQTATCPKALLDAATEPYDKIADFDAYKKKFISCVQDQKISCLRRLTWRNIQISFGVDGLGDRRPLLYPKWKKKDFDEMAALLKKGISSEGDERDFPFPQAEEYIGMRGGFQKKHGGWLLTHYLGGD